MSKQACLVIGCILWFVAAVILLFSTSPPYVCPSNLQQPCKVNITECRALNCSEQYCIDFNAVGCIEMVNSYRDLTNLAYFALVFGTVCLLYHCLVYGKLLSYICRSKNQSVPV